MSLVHQSLSQERRLPAFGCRWYNLTRRSTHCTLNGVYRMYKQGIDMTRTNVVIDEKKLKAAKKAFDISTTKDLIDFALTELLKMHGRKDILSLKGKIKMDLDLSNTRETG